MSVILTGCNGMTTPIREADRSLVVEYEARAGTLLNQEEQVLLTNAESRSAEECIQAKGFPLDYPTRTVGQVFAGPEFWSRAEMWLFDDVTAARDGGYGFNEYLEEHSRWLGSSPMVDPSRTGTTLFDPGNLPPERRAEFDLAFFGGDRAIIEVMLPNGQTEAMYAGGCLGEARKAIWGDLAQYLRVQGARGAVVSTIWERALSDRGVTAALRQWRSCMGDRGFEFEDPPATVQAALEEAQAGSGTELVIATADAECKQESGLSDAFAIAYLTAAEEVFEEFEGILLGAGEFRRRRSSGPSR
ncbi:MAG: hypothetical protein ACRDVM_02285 [Acidimicrobiia bacterium]